MTWTDVWNGVGSFFESLFKILESLRQGPNVILWVLIFVLLCGWVVKMAKYNREAAENGTLK